MNRRRWIFLVCLLSGCSTHPLVDVCDFFKPGKTGPNKVQPYGGVAIPQGPIVPVAAPNIAVGPPSAFPGGGVIPPPAPLPGNRPPGGFQLQPPMGDLPPPMPPPPPIPPR